MACAPPRSPNSWAATRRRCGSGCTGSTPSAPRPRASGWAAARSAASSSANGCAGGGPARGPPAPTRTSPQTSQGHRLLHHSAAGRDRGLRRRARPGDPPQLPARARLDPDGHRVKALLDYGRGPEKTRVYGALRVGDGQEVTMTAPSRNSIGYQQLLAAVETANPAGTIVVITDNLSSHSSGSTRTWLADHPRIQHAFIPKGACWLNLQEGWWRLFRREAFAGQSFATPEEITLATWVATCQLNARARPWVWGRPPPSPRHRRRVFVYRL